MCSGTPPGSASSGEADQYNVFAEQLRILGAQVEKAAAKVSGEGGAVGGSQRVDGPVSSFRLSGLSCLVQDYLGIPVSLGPRVVLSPSFAVTLR